MAALEGGRAALALATGQAAEMTALLTLCEQGDEIVSASHALRRHLFPVRSEFPQARHQHHFRRSRRSGEFPPRDHQKDQGGVRRDPGQSADQRARHRGGGEHRARGRRAADRRQHLRLALPVPPVRVRRRHRGALGDQVHRRPRHHHGRRDRRVGQVPLGQRQLPRHDRALARLSRRALLRNLRRLRLHHEGAHGDAAHLRPGAVAVQRLDAAAGPRDAAPAHEGALRQRARGGAVPGVASAGELGELSRARRPTATMRWRKNTCRGAAPAS